MRDKEDGWNEKEKTEKEELQDQIPENQPKLGNQQKKQKKEARPGVSNETDWQPRDDFPQQEENAVAQ